MILLFFFFNYFTLHTQPTQYFENPIIYNAQNGINVGNISSIVLDKNGFLWIAGNKGLQRFDGYYFKDYLNDPEDSTTLFSNSINHLYYDEAENKIWISNWNKGGISILDLDNETFKNFLYDASITNGLPDNDLFWTYKDKYGQFWSSVFTKGLVKYLPKSGTFESLSIQPDHADEDINIASINSIQCYTQDLVHDSILWLGSNSGLLKLNVRTSQIQHFQISAKRRSGLEIRSLLFYKKDQIFVGTWGQGMFSFNPSTGLFSRCNLAEEILYGSRLFNIRHISVSPDSLIWITSRAGLMTYDAARDSVIDIKVNDLPHDKLYGAIFSDHKRRQIVWSGDVMYIYDPIRQQIKPYRYKPEKEGYNNTINRILESEDPNELWLAVDLSEGLYKINLQTGLWEVYPPPNSYFKERVNFRALDILKSKSGLLLVLSSESIYQLNEQDKSLIPWDMPQEIKGFGFRRMIEDRNENIWIGTTEDGIIKINLSDKKIIQYKKELTDIDRFSPGIVWALQEDRNGNVWIRSDGYSVYDVKRDTFFNFPHFFHNKSSTYHIQSLGIDANGNVWIASQNCSIGITNADEPEKGIVEYFDQTSGLQTVKPFRFMLDQENNVWITSKNIEKISHDRSVSNYYTSAHILNEYFETAVQLSDGKIAVGFTEGIGIFHPDSLQISKNTPIPYVRSFKVFDKKIETDIPLYALKEINLEPNQNFFSLEISAIDQSFSGDLEFLYQLEGFDPQWVDPKGRDYIAYTNVESGNYLFKLKVKSQDGLWSEKPIELLINIGTHWYRTFWAYSLFLLLICFLIYRIYRFQLYKKLVDSESKRLKEVDQLKNTLFTNITHEFRSPLTVIKGMVGTIKSDLEDEHHDDLENSLEIIDRNSDGLLSLINEMLDLAKIESGGMKLNLVQVDGIPFIKYLIQSFQSLAQEKNIDFSIHCDIEHLEMDLDANKFTTIVTNLLSNAIKFTPQNGKVVVYLNRIQNKNTKFIELKIKDNGLGISKEDQLLIFDKFYQVDSSSSKTEKGTGIGLSLVKEFVELMQGSIDVESSHGKGSIFSVKIPITNDAALTDDFVLVSPSSVAKSTVASINLADNQGLIEDDNDLALVLIIEDNLDVAHYIKTCLKRKYQTLHANNGEIGIKRALEKIPDVIISDVMMPKKDGFEVCEYLKSNELTDHIPIIMLTAKATFEDRLVGLSYGADAYLTKPFEKAELLTRIDQLILLRKKMLSKFEKIGIERLLEKNIKNSETEFLGKIITVIHENIAANDFGPVALALKLHLSESQLYRKLKATCGQSTAVFIRSIRLQKGKELIQTTDKTVSEIAYDVGFNEPSYFSRVFKKEFGHAPSDISK